MSKQKRLIRSFAVLWVMTAGLWPYCCYGVSSWGHLFEFEQPDGSLVPVKVWGDEFYRRMESLDGYTLIREKGNRWICYADLADQQEEFVSTGWIYDGSQMPDNVRTQIMQRRNPRHPQPFEKRLRLKSDIRKKMALEKRRALFGDIVLLPEYADGQTTASQDLLTEPGPQPALDGSKIGLTMLIDFPDYEATIPQSEINNYCNQVGYSGNGNNGSIRDFFYEVSGGVLEYTNVVTAYMRADYSKSFYDNDGDGARMLIKECFSKLVDSGFNFSGVSKNGSTIQYLNVFYAGPAGSGDLWPHRWAISPTYCDGGVCIYNYQITHLGTNLKIGTFCHENGHLLCGWPDLYDYGGESRGCGNYDLMASGNYAGSSKNPTVPNPYLRAKKGWETYIDITSALPGTLYTAAANPFDNTLQPLTTYIFNNPSNPDEYFLIENCQKIGRRADMPDAGLLIWHIDNNKYGYGANNEEQMTPSQHYCVSVEQADGLFHLENDNNGGGAGDLFHGGYADTFTDTTLPDAKWWDGSDSGLAVTNISDLGSDMTFFASQPEILARYEFEGNTLDSAFDNHGTAFGTPGYVSGAIGSQAIDFDGTCFVEIPRLVAHTFSICFWMRTNTAGQNGSQWWSGSGLVDGEVGGTTEDFGISLLGNQVAFGVGNPDTTFVAPVNVTDDQWHHVTVTRDHQNGRMKIFIDGIERISDTGPTGPKGAPSRLTLGCLQTGLRYYEGQMDDVRLYGYLLTEDQISWLSDGVPPSPNPAAFVLSPAAEGSDTISMTAQTGSDPHGPVEYYFEEISGSPGGTDSGWRSNPSWTARDLRPSTSYSYQVKMRDAVGNESTASTIVEAVTYPTADMNRNGRVNLDELALLTEQWMTGECGPANFYCDQADLDTSGLVNYDDFAALSANWLTPSILPYPLAWWKIDQPAESALEDSVGGIQGTPHNMNSANWTSGITPVALSFDGIDDYVQMDNYLGLTGTGPRSIGVWVRTSSPGAVLSWGAEPGANGQRFWWLINGSGQQMINVRGAFAVGTFDVADGKWHHLTAVTDPADSNSALVGDIRFYVDGQPDTTTYFTPSMPIDTAADEPMRIGVLTADEVPGTWFTGQIDDLRLYTQALLPTQITQLVVEKPLQLYLAFDETSGTTASDSSAWGRNALVLNNPAWTTSGHQGGCLTFDGYDDFVQVNGYRAVTGRAPRTTCAWIKTQNNGTVFSYGDDGMGQKWMLLVSEEGVPLFVPWGGIALGTTNIADGQWHHVAITLEDVPDPTLENVILYVDGIAESMTYSSSQPINTGSRDPFRAGVYLTTSLTNFFSGQIDEIMIYDRCLSSEEIKTIAK